MRVETQHSARLFLTALWKNGILDFVGYLFFFVLNIQFYDLDGVLGNVVIRQRANKVYRGGKGQAPLLCIAVKTDMPNVFYKTHKNH